MPIISGGTTGVVASALAGYEIGYDQITASVNVTGTTEGTATTIITCAAHTFDGQPALCEFYTVGLRPSAVVFESVVVGLFESGTLVNRLALEKATDTSNTNRDTTAYGALRFTPSAGSHSFVVGAWVPSTTGTPLVTAGVGGAGANPPAFVRFTKV